MSATGIGAAVRRKEDFRFITGKGQYTDDISRPGQSYIHFLRSPHAHAKIKSIDTTAAAAMPGVLARPHRRRPRRRQDRRPDLRLDDPFQGRLADEDGAASGDRERQGLLCRRPGRGGGRRDAGAGARCRREGRGRLRGAAGGGRSRQGAGDGAPQIHEVAPHNTIYQWHLGDAKAVGAAFKSAAHVTKLDIVNNRLVPNAMEPRAAIGEYDAGTDELHAVEHHAEPACGAARHLGLRRHGAGAQAARDRARRRRRLRLEDLHLSRGSRVPVGGEEGRPPGEMGRRPLARPSSPTRMAAITSPTPRWRSTPTARSPRCGSRPSPISAPICRPSRRRCRPISTRTLLSGQYDIPQIYCEVDAVYTNTVPVDAYRGAGRPEATFVVERLIEVERARARHSIRPSCGARTSSASSRTRRR